VDFFRPGPGVVDDRREQCDLEGAAEDLVVPFGATPAQVALAWLLAQGDDIAPIPGTKRASRVEENTAADRVELSAEQIARLNDLTPAAGERHEEANMATIDR
jgi:aryl-alcohol dehydrogenase-like predicted oxidoreductase